MEIENKKAIAHEQGHNSYHSQGTNEKSIPVTKIRRSKLYLFISGVIHAGICGVFLILLLVGYIFKGKLGFSFSSLQFGLSIGYISFAILVDVLFFILVANKLEKREHFRFMVFAILILSTLIFAGSLPFWGVPVLLFYSLITLIIWVVQILIASLFFKIVERLTN